MEAALTEPVDQQDVPAATVVITTRNRKAELSQALRSAFAQDITLDVLVLDDASSDGTSAMVAREFPRARLERAERPIGLIAQRNRASELVRTRLIISIDDDAVFTAPDTARRAVAAFDDSLIGAVALPYVNVRQGNAVHQMAADDCDIYLAHVYLGTAHALHVETFRRLGGYRAFFFREYEEQDYCLRLLDAGFFVRLGYTAPIHHFQSPVRVHGDIVYYGERNQILMAWLDSPRFFKEAAGVTFRAFRRAVVRRTFPLKTVAGLVAGYARCWTYRHLRRPVSSETYFLFRRIMRSNGLITLTGVRTETNRRSYGRL